MKNNVFISIIIPTLNSSKHIDVLLKSIKKQKNIKKEIILVDNGSVDSTLDIAKKYNVKIIMCSGKPPQVAKQRNMGATVAKGKYLYFVDHDMELTNKFLVNLYKQINNSNNYIDAWYVPEKIICNNKILSIARNFEATFINNTIISAARIIKKNKFKLLAGFDEKLSGGPADWDFDIQLKTKNSRLAVFDEFVYHHEENLSLWSYINKKKSYINGEIIYKKKWKKNKKVYNEIVLRQYSIIYRMFVIFIESGKWILLLKHFHEYLLFIFVKILMVINYVYWRRRYVK